jgi:signal transduction histidine kinase|nr:ATP-binding protein [Kofleriaceae bacterium]
MSRPELPERLGEALPALLEGLRHAEVGIMVFFQHGGKTYKLYANDAATRPLGYKALDWLGLPMYSTVAPEQRDALARLYSLTEPPAPAIELVLRHADGTALRGEYTAAHAVVESGVVTFLISRVVGPQLQAQLSIVEADRVALVGALAAGFAHEINNPLTSVVLNLRSLRKLLAGGGSDAPFALRCIDDLTLAAERIASNVRAFQSLASPGVREAIDLGAIVSSSLRLAMPTLEPRAMVTRKIAPAPVLVVGEEARVGQAVLAMLLFASSGFAEPSHNGNEIAVTVELRGGDAVIEISDNGQALAPDEASHAFDPFFRTHARGAGVGVGLGVARSIAVTLGGDVVLTARDGGGAVVTLRLPVAA